MTNPSKTTEIIEMYNSGASTRDIMAHFNISRTTIYDRMRKSDIEFKHRCEPVWSDAEEQQLISARKAGITGSEYYDYIPTRTFPAIRDHLFNLGLTSGRDIR